ncbi:MAG: DUF5050 domain-containing protein [Clostridia bacterium]|nr:DUF5050 domain-containing protein [Clostridia bacterium]
MKKIFAILMCTFLAVCTCSCGNNNGGQPSIDISTQFTLGSTNGNILCSGLFAHEDGFIYYGSNGLYRISESGDEWSQIADGKVSNINVLDNSIYCTVESDGTPIMHRIDAQTGEKTKLAEDNVQSLIVVDETIYFSSRSENSISKMSVNGENRAKLSDSFAMNISFYNNYLYFVAEDGKYNLHKMRTDGQEHTVLTTTETMFAVVDNGNVYYASIADDTAAVYKQKLDKNSSPTEILNLMPMRINVYSDNIYYTTADGLFKCDKDGKSTVQLCAGIVNHIFTGGGWIYYTLEESGASKLYRVRPDASESQLFLTLVVE